jgi:hypothetical protein
VCGAPVESLRLAGAPCFRKNRLSLLLIMR